jgi:membrane protease YdiL (CAAX protease family)
MELTHTRGQVTGPSNRLVQMMRRHPLLCYFLIALGFSWAYELIVYGILHLPEASIGRAFILGPTFAAFLMMAITEGKPGVRCLLRRCVLWRVGIPWYLFVLLGVPVLVLLGFFVLPGAVAAFRAPAPAFALSYLELFILIFFATSLFEEPGWRGFALPRLQQRSGPLVGTLLLGALWALWHLPLFLFVPGGFNGAGTGFVGIMVSYAAFSVGIVALAVIITWVFNNARGSLLLVMLLHTSYDTAYSVVLPKLFPSLPVTPLINGLGNLNIVLIVVAVLVIVATRGRLGYQRYQRETALPAPVTDKEQEQGEAHASI